MGRDGARQVAAEMADAARNWIDSLSADQRTIAVGAGPSDDATDEERRRWFYTPTDHGGLTSHQQRPAQQQLAMKLVASGLSEAGFTTVASVIGLENVLDRVEGFGSRMGRERGRDPGLYYLRVFGEPGGAAPWGWRFGGHHVSLNNLVVDGELAATTPCFIGTNPATAPLLGGQLRLLGATEDIARELVRSLDDALAARAVLLPRAPSDIVGGNRSRIGDGDELIPLTGIWRGTFADPGERDRLQASSDALAAASRYTRDDHEVIALTATPKGVPAADLDAGQRELLQALLSTYLGRVPAGASPLHRYTEADELDGVHFAWAGSTVPGEPHYYRLQAPRLLVEYDNTQNDANHAHAVWRDPVADFGLDVLTAHRTAHH
ncbi:DUF3500 domain-containing protein [Pseudonocardia sp. TRM90224]|uniref:DUF3500 domain-containing protein n=1 Tax=Pseudonocardia sp. TRM90224 TaxID=2812678 RepID=UPI001E630D3F|nr:DUF3500 domain-containing protein [Pseudonocardia sp. TRM90224]